MSKIDGAVHEQDRSAMVGSIAKVVYNVLKVNFKHLVIVPQDMPKAKRLYQTMMPPLFECQPLEKGSIHSLTNLLKDY